MRYSALPGRKTAVVVVLAPCGNMTRPWPGPRIWTTLAAEKSASDETQCLVTTLYWEARAASRQVMIAIAWVVLNRRESSAYPNTICTVVHQGGEQPPYQFSYWCDGQPEVPRNAAAWEVARQIAAEMLQNPPSDPTHGALFFHSADIKPEGTREHKETVQLGKYIFYR